MDSRARDDAPGRSLPAWAPPAGRPAGWYPDPAGLPGQRFYDGRVWTDAIDGRFRPATRDTLPTMHIGAALGAAVVLAVSLVVSRLVVEVLLPRQWPIAAYTGISVAIGYLPSLAWCVAASRRWGTGRLAADLGLRARWADAGWGPLVWGAVLVGQVVAGGIVLALDVPFTSNTDGIAGLADDRTYILTFLAAAVVAAPIVEEIVFRGVMLRGLRSRLDPVPAVVIQGVVFGAVHVDPARGAGNIGLVIVLSVVGIVLGGAVELLGRIPPSMIAHAIINSIALIVVLNT